MRNTYKSYKLCKTILKYGDIHVCGENKCDAIGKTGTSRFRNYPKHIKNFKKKKSPQESDMDDLLIGLGRDVVFENYAKSRGYIETNVCSNSQPVFTSITTKGLELTDDLFLPFTPIGLWKEIYKEHKVFGRLMITIITSLVLSASGITLAYAYNLIKNILG